MIADIAGSNLLFLLYIIFALLSFFFLIDSLLLSWKIWCLKSRTSLPKKKLSHSIRFRSAEHILVVFSTTLAIVLYTLWSEYRITDAFAWEREETKEFMIDLFKTEKREEPAALSGIDQALHLEWYEKNISNIDTITKKIIDTYEKNITFLFDDLPHREDPPSKEETNDSFREKKAIFKNVVNSQLGDLSSEELWEGHLAGRDVCLVKGTSENVFQTAILAEGAHSKYYEEDQKSDEHLNYAAGAFEYFESSLDFKSRKAGEAQTIRSDDVAFREGKISFREEKNSQNNGTKYSFHFKLYSYGSFRYAFLEIQNDYSNPEYIIRLYYLSSSCFNLGPIMDETDFKEICSEIDGYWDTFYEVPEISRMSEEEIKEKFHLEDNTLQEIPSIRAKLKKQYNKAAAIK